MKKVKICFVNGRDGYSLQITDQKGSGERLAGPKAWGNPYNRPTASFTVDAEELKQCIDNNAWEE